MATTAQIFYRGSAPTVSGTLLFTTPNTVAADVATNILVANTNAIPVAFNVNLTMSGTSYGILSGVSLAANSTAFFDLKQVLLSGQTITGNASAAGVNFSISGVQIL